MIRWKYVLSRLILLTTIAGVLWFTLAPILRWSLIYGGQSITGARVELRSLNIDWVQSQIQLRELQVADPNRPKQNLFEAGNVVLDFETHAALRRKLIISDGRIEGLQIQTHRDKSGALDGHDESKDPDGGSFVDGVAEKGEAWLKSTADKLQQDLENDLHTVQLAQELRERWPREYDALRLRGERIESEAKQLERQIEPILERPLDHAHQIQPALARADKLRQDVVETRRHLNRLHEQMKIDQDAVVQAKQHDEAYLREKLRLDSLDGQTLNEYLLGSVWGSRVETGLRLINMTRQNVGGDEDAPPNVVPASRGLSVIFPGYHSNPDLLVRRLGLNGTGSANGTPFSFDAEVFDLTNQPRRHREPTKVNVSAEGAVRLTAQAVLDRRRKTPHDHFVVDIPSVPQPKQILGDKDKLAIELAAGIASVRANIQVIGEEIEGWIAVRQDQLQPRPILSPSYSKYLTADSLASLGDINQLDAQLLITGDVRRPMLRMQSTLGPQLAASLNQAMKSELDRRRQQLTVQGEELVQKELDDLQQRLVSEHQDILAKLEIGDEQLKMIRSQLTASLGSPEQIIGRGKQLLDMLK